jgi:hypothetical protein
MIKSHPNYYLLCFCKNSCVVCVDEVPARVRHNGHSVLTLILFYFFDLIKKLVHVLLEIQHQKYNY